MAAQVKNENYTTIQGWMINDLKLTGNELIAYAVIYGFSQTTGQAMTCSQEYISNWCNISRESTNKLLKRMIEKGLIAKKLNKTRGAIKLYSYDVLRTSEQSSRDESSHVTSKKKSRVTSDVKTHNNNKQNNNNKYIKKNSFLNFHQREYTKEEMVNLEKSLLLRQFEK